MTPSRTRTFHDLWFAAAVLAFAIGLPVVLAALHPPFVSHSYPEPYLPFELLGFSGTVAVLLLAARHLTSQRPLTLERALPAIAAVLVGMYYLGIVSEFSRQSWDYDCYEKAAQAIVSGQNPYSHCYLYPPLMAQAMAGLSQLLRAALDAVPMDIPRNDVAVWFLVFYLYQCTQWILLMVAFLMCYALARRLGMTRPIASSLVALLFLIDNPMLRTLRHSQLNLWILDFFLGAILFTRRHPIAAGLLAAFGGHLKLYPLILLAPWAAVRRWKAVTAAVLGFAAIGLLTTRFGTDWTLWREFVDSSRSFPASGFFRDNSLRGLISNTFLLLAGDRLTLLARIVFGLASVTVAAWFARRFVRRERALRAAAAADPSTRTYIDRAREYGHALDGMAFTLIVSPVVWEHVYVLAVPIVIWAVATHWRTRPAPIAAGAFLMLALPTFDLYPFSYHRLAGLLVLLGGTEEKV